MKISWLPAAICTFGLVLLSVLFWRDIAPSGRVSLNDNLAGYHPSISELFPTGRLSAMEKHNDGFEQVVLVEPVYFTVRLPREMEQARVRLRYRARDLDTLKLGLETLGDVGETWQYDFRDLPTQTNEEGSEHEVVFLLNNAAITNRRIRFMVSSPDLDSARSTLAIQHIGIDFDGEKLSFSDIVKKGVEKMKQLL